MKTFLILMLIVTISGCGCLEKGSEFPGCLLPCDNGPCKN